jgi:Protein of unknown function (DUF732)
MTRRPMHKALLVLATILALTACADDASQNGAASSAASTNSSPAAPTTSPGRTSASFAATQEVTPEDQFIAAMEQAGLVPLIGTAEDAIDLALAICVAYGSGRSFTEVMTTLAGGSMSLDQMMDLEQAATLSYCPRFYVPNP